MCCQGPRDYRRMWRQWTKVLRSKLLTWYTFPKVVKVVGWWHKNPQPLGEQNRLKMGRLLEAVPCHDPLRYHSSMVFQSFLLTKVIQFSRYIWLYLIFKSLQKSKMISRYRKLSSWRPTFLPSLMIFRRFWICSNCWRAAIFLGPRLPRFLFWQAGESVSTWNTGWLYSGFAPEVHANVRTLWWRLQLGLGTAYHE